MNPKMVMTLLLVSRCVAGDSSMKRKKENENSAASNAPKEITTTISEQLLSTTSPLNATPKNGISSVSSTPEIVTSNETSTINTTSFTTFNSTPDAVTTADTSSSTVISKTTPEVKEISSTAASRTPSYNGTGDDFPIGTTESQSGDPQTLIIIVSAAAVSGVLIGVVATVIVVIVCKRKTRESKTVKQPSFKRTFSYTLKSEKETENPTKPEPPYIQILPDLVGSSDDGGVDKIELENLENVKGVNDLVKLTSEDDDYAVVADEFKPDHVKDYGAVNDTHITKAGDSEDDGYAIVDDEVKEKVKQPKKGNNSNRMDKRQMEPDGNYSHIYRTDGRKISDTNPNYSHVDIDDLYANKRISKSDNALADTKNQVKANNKATLNNADDGYHSNFSTLDASIDSALQDMDKTIASFDNGDSDKSVYSDDDDIEEETYNRLGSLKKKSEFGQNKFYYGQMKKKTRSRSLPAEDLKPQFKKICDEIDTYDHLHQTENTETEPDRTPTYINWAPPRHAKSKSLPESENLEYAKGIRKDADNYSHINLTEVTPKRKFGVATMDPAHLHVDTKISYNKTTPETNGYDSTEINRINKPKGAKINEKEKQNVFTIKDDGSEDETPHTYFILEPSTAL